MTARPPSGRARTLVHNRQPLPEWRVHKTEGWWQRAVGLLATSQLDDPRGLWISPCRSIHTVGMRYAIDVVFIDERGRVKKLVRGLQPWRATACSGARSTLELRAGAIDELQVGLLDLIAIAP